MRQLGARQAATAGAGQRGHKDLRVSDRSQVPGHTRSRATVWEMRRRKKVYRLSWVRLRLPLSLLLLTHQLLAMAIRRPGWNGALRMLQTAQQAVGGVGQDRHQDLRLSDH